MRNKNYRAAAYVGKVLMVLFFILISITVIYPLVYVVSGAFGPGNNIADIDIKPFSKGFTLEHFIYLFLLFRFSTGKKIVVIQFYSYGC